MENFELAKLESKVVLPLSHRIYSRNIRKDQSARVASNWFHFSTFMPFYLSSLASKMSRNEFRLNFIIICFEELGSGRLEHFHDQLFREALEKVGITPRDVSKLLSTEYLKNLLRTKDDYFLMGVGCGLEITANENIERLFNSLWTTRKQHDELRRAEFFRIHFLNEDEHIKKNKENFSKFCDSPAKMYSFTNGVIKGLRFWDIFWRECSV